MAFLGAAPFFTAWLFLIRYKSYMYIKRSSSMITNPTSFLKIHCHLHLIFNNHSYFALVTITIKYNTKIPLTHTSCCQGCVTVYSLTKNYSSAKITNKIEYTSLFLHTVKVRHTTVYMSTLTITVIKSLSQSIIHFTYRGDSRCATV